MPWARRWWSQAALVALWAALYLPHLRTSPGWYGDETTALSVAGTMLHGAPHDQAVRYVFAPYGAIDLGLVAVVSRLFGGDILGGRLVHALMALAVAWLLSRHAVRLCGRAGAWVAAMAFLSAAPALLYFRMVMPHAGLTLGATAVVLGLSGKPGPRRAWLAGLGLLLAVGSHVSAALLVPVAMLGCGRRWPSWPRVFGPALAYVVLWLAWGLVAVRPWLLSELGTLASRYGESDGFSRSRTLAQFMSSDAFHVVGYLALPLAIVRRKWVWGASLVLLTLLIVPNRPHIRMFAYPALPLVPLLALGWGMIVHEAVRIARQHARRMLPLVQAASVGLPALGLALPALVDAERPVMVTPFPEFETRSPAEVEQVAAWLDAHTTPGDLVLANASVGWLLHVRSASLLELTQASGYGTTFTPDGVPPGRFLYEVSTARAKYVVLGDVDRSWALKQPHVTDALAAVWSERWPSAWKGPTYEILANPRFTAGP